MNWWARVEDDVLERRRTRRGGFADGTLEMANKN